MKKKAIHNHIKILWEDLKNDWYLEDREKIPDGMLEQNLIRSPSWTTSGYQGGNCWGDEPDYYVSDDTVPEFESLEIIVNSLIKDITYSDFKKIQKHIKEHSYNDVQYYGNVDYNKYKYIELDVLTNVIFEMIKDD